MSKLTQTLEREGFAGRVLTDKQVNRLIAGSDASRYGLVNRALQDGSLIRIKRGLYTLRQQDPSQLPHHFTIAQSLLPGSYISFESALSYHGWIPEGVYNVSSVAPGRKSFSFGTDRFGNFSFEPIALNRYMFLVSVHRAQIGESAALVASPLRALMDLVARRKAEWRGLGWLVDGLRIDQDQLAALKRSDFAALRSVYKHKLARTFLTEFESAWAALSQNEKER